MSQENEKTVLIIPTIDAIDSLPEPPNCFFDARLTIKSIVEWFWEGKSYKVIAENYPGYLCPDCGAEYGDPGTLYKYEELAAEALEARGDNELREFLNERKLSLERLDIPTTTFSPEQLDRIKEIEKHLKQ